MADQKLKQIIKALEGKTYSVKGVKMVEMEHGRLDFKRKFVLKKILKSGNVRLGYVGEKDRIAKVRIIGDKNVLALGSGRGSDNYYLDLF